MDLRNLRRSTLGTALKAAMSPRVSFGLTEPSTYLRDDTLRTGDDRPAARD